jgi:CDP-glycerol glycerophosphotransferase (TagB/SpsB family)
MRAAAQHESTVPDAAAIIMYGPTFSEKWGNLAAQDARIARGIDFILEGTENPYIAAAVAGLPLIAQVYRNHQASLNPQAVMETVKRSRAETKQRQGRTFRIPFTKRTVTIRFRFQLPAVENFTNDPDALAHYVFEDPKIQKAMEKANIQVAMNGSKPK